MAEYIDRESLMATINKANFPEEDWDTVNNASYALELVRWYPAADVVEVPCHCKDCRYNDPSWQLSADSIGCRYWGIYPNPDDWCCKAERKGR